MPCVESQDRKDEDPGVEGGSCLGGPQEVFELLYLLIGKTEVGRGEEV